MVHQYYDELIECQAGIPDDEGSALDWSKLVEPMNALGIELRSKDDPIRAFLTRGIEAGELSVGDRLPTEREFAQDLALTRNSVRRSLAQLEATGRIVRHVGRGTFLASVHDDVRGADDSLNTNPVEVMAVRLIIEPQLAALAATYATAQNFERMRHCVEQGAIAASLEEFESWDSALHTEIAEATQNRFLVRLFQAMNAVRREPMWGTLKKRSLTTESRRAAEREHLHIVQALCDRDAALAERLSREHLIRVRQSLLGDL